MKIKMLLLKKIQLNNFLSHENTTLEFSENENLLIDGISGSGKSTIFDAIVWALYGEGRTDNRSMIRKGEKKCSVDLYLEDASREGQKCIKIARSATSGGRHTLEVFIAPSASQPLTAHPDSGVKALQRWIETDLVGASYLLFVNSIAYVQGGGDLFVTQTAGKRKELLLELLGKTDFVALYEAVRDKLSTTIKEIARMDGEIVGRKSTVETLTGSLEREKRKIENVDILSLKKEQVSIEKSISGYNDFIKHIFDISEKIRSKKEDISRIAEIASEKRSRALMIEGLIRDVKLQEGAILPLTELISSIPSAESNLSAAIERLQQADAENMKLMAHLSNRPNIIDFESQIQEITKRIQDHKVRHVPVCPSGDACPYMGKENELLAFYNEQLENLLTKNREQSKEIIEWTTLGNQIKAVDDIDSIRLEVEAKRAHLNKCIGAIDEMKKISDASDKISEHEISLENITKEIETLTHTAENIKNEIADLEVVVSTLKIEEAVKQSEFKSNNTRLETIKNTLYDVNTAEIRIIDIKKSIEKEMNIIESLLENIHTIEEKQKGLMILKEAFGANGIKAMVIDYLMPRLETNINNILSRLSDFHVRFDTQRQSADGDGIVEGLFITIINETGNELQYESLSGGEKLRVNIAITEGLAKITSKAGFRLMDEAIHSMSPEMTADLLDVVSVLQADYPQILAISHIPEVKDMFEKHVNVKKISGLSTIQSHGR